ncbi:MAG: type II toxin-antitoxin system VapC family toxin [Cryobacterium sp.]|nr:type II toxin-antitoxin system VapC family toxin [Cryobacterium sp.]
MKSSPRIALDSSVAIPLLVERHEAHSKVTAWARGKQLTLCGHALVETYAVLTRLPGDARVEPEDAVALIDDNFEAKFTLSPELANRAHNELAKSGVAGGATYDGLIALTALEHNVVLATRDARARSTYEAVGAVVEIV